MTSSMGLRRRWVWGEYCMVANLFLRKPRRALLSWWSVTLPVTRGEIARGTILQATLEVCKDVSSNQVQTTLSLDPASKAEVDSAVSAGWAGEKKQREQLYDRSIMLLLLEVEERWPWLDSLLGHPVIWWLEWCEKPDRGEGTGGRWDRLVRSKSTFDSPSWTEVLIVDWVSTYLSISLPTTQSSRYFFLAVSICTEGDLP